MQRAIVAQKCADQLAQVRKQCGYKLQLRNIQRLDCGCDSWREVPVRTAILEWERISTQVGPTNLSVCRVGPSGDSEELVLRDSIQIGEETWGMYVLKDPGEKNQPIDMKIKKIK